MSKSVIDERVVQMSFDNDQFEKGVSQTISSLEELDTNLDKLSDGVYFDKMEASIKKVESAFSASGMVINGILLSIGQTINNYLVRGLNALTQGIRGGFAEYNTQMDATQTIMANVKDEGKGIADVTAALDELNTYADKTIYNFTEMTKNIGMFTAAGANLDTSVSTIKGLANAAALVGANSTTAARAWYQVSQAMSAGVFKLMDWKSLEVSNIAGEGFKSVLTEVARKDGLAVAKMIDNGKALRETLQSGWLTAERFAEAMKILSGDLSQSQIEALGYTEEQAQKLRELAIEAVNAATKVKTFGQLMDTTAEAIGSGWAVTFRNLIGDFERAKDFFTRISLSINNIIDKISDYRNRLISYVWNTDGYDGKGSAFNNIKHTLDNILAIFGTFIGAVRAGFDNIFPWNDIKEQLINFTNFANKTTKALVLNTDKSITQYNKKKTAAEKDEDVDPQNIQDTYNDWDLDAVNDKIISLIKVFRGLFAGVDIIFRTIGDTISWVISQIPGVNNFFSNLENGNVSLIDNLANIADKVLMVRDMIKDLNLIPNILNLIKQSIINIIKNNPIIKGMIDVIWYAVQAVKAFFATLNQINISPLDVLVGALKLIGGAIAALFYFINEGINKVIQFITGNVDFSFFETIGNEIMTLIVILGELGKGTISVADVFEFYKKKVLDAFDAIMNSPFVQGIIGFFTNLWNNLKTFWDNIVYMFQNLGDNISGFYDKYFKDLNIDLKSMGIFGALAAIAIMFYNLLKDVEGWASLGARIGDVLNAIATRVNSEALLNIAKAIGILAASLFLLSLIPYKVLLDTVSMVTVILFMFMGLFAVIKGVMTAIEGIEKAIDPLERMGLRLAKGIQKFIQRAGTAIMLEALGDAILKITIAIVGLALAIKFLPDEMDKAIQVITGMVIALGALMIVLNVLTKPSMVNGLLDFADLFKLSISNLFSAVSQGVRMAALAIMLEAFTDSIIKLALALAIITKVAESDNFGVAVAVLAGMMFVLAGLISALVLLTNKLALVDVGTYVGLGFVLIGFTTVLIAVAAAAAILCQFDWEKILVAMVSIGGVIVAIGYAANLATKFVTPKTAAVFAGLALMFVALGAALAVIIYMSTMIQDGHQIAALAIAVGGMFLFLAEIMGIMAIMKTINVDFKVILSVSAVMGAIAVAFLAIGYAISLLDGVTLDISVILTLAGMLVAMNVLVMEVLGIGVVLAAADKVIPGIGPAIIGTVLAVAAYIAAVGLAFFLISESVLNLQEAFANAWEAIQYIADNGTYISETLGKAALSIAQAIPSLFPMFVALGVAIGTAVSGLVLGLRAMINGIVIQVATMILQIIVQISDWINSNADLIQTALTKAFKALLNIAIIALNVALFDALPTLLLTMLSFMYKAWAAVMSTISNIIGLGLEWLGNTILEQFGDDSTWNLIGTTFLVFGYGFQDLATLIHDAIDAICGFLGQGIDILTQGTIALDLFTDSTQEMASTTEEVADSTGESTKKMSVAFTDMSDIGSKSIDIINNKLEENGNASKKLTNTVKGESKKQQDSYVETSAVAAESSELTANSWIDSSNIMSMVTDGNIGNITSIFENGFDLNLDNQDTYWLDFLDTEAFYGDQYVEATAGYLIKNSDLYETYWKENAGLAEEYYTAMATYNSMMDSAPDNAARQEAMDYKKKYVDPALEALTGSKLSLQGVLADGIDYEVTKKMKKSQEETFNSWTSMFDAMGNYASNWTAPEVNTNAYTPNYGSSSGTNTDELEKELQNRNDIIGKADSEIQPKDLTPTIDLDKLKNEVNQANGVMTGSLLAAQNAAIGDYINTDSELNPFLKDRWQNVYNFTQNNYSPKALSRIDIYRQTQNQLRLSRGM